MTKAKDAAALRVAPLDTPTDLRANAVPEISGALNIVLADMFALYLKTKNFHWHVSGPHFRDYHLLLDEQGEQIFDRRHHAALDRPHQPLAARVGQRRGLRHPPRHARGAARRQTSSWRRACAR